MQIALTLNNEYIGDSKTAYRLCVKQGIKPERKKQDSSVCSIGFCEKEQKWYGWSHRAMFGFAIGHTVKKGDAGYLPKNREEHIESIKKWYSNSEVIVEENNIEIHVKKSTSVPIEPPVIITEPLDVPYKGEWTSQTLEDCKQMAIDFAESVS